MRSRWVYLPFAAIAALLAGTVTAGAQSTECGAPGKPSVVLRDSLESTARRLYHDVHGTQRRDSVMVVALMFDAKCRLLQSAYGMMAVPYSTRDAFDALLGKRARRRMRMAGMLPSPDESGRRMLVFGVVPDSLAR
jgi:hypothetical protein